MRYARRGLRLAVVLVALAVYYLDFPGDLQNHAHWAKVAWIPFVSPPVDALDCVRNVLLFVPFGAVTRLSFPRRTLLGFLLGLALSLAGEGTQVFSHGRVPSMTDVTCNAIGTVIGSAALRMAGF